MVERLHQLRPGQGVDRAKLQRLVAAHQALGCDTENIVVGPVILRHIGKGQAVIGEQDRPAHRPAVEPGQKPRPGDQVPIGDDVFRLIGRDLGGG